MSNPQDTNMSMDLVPVAGPSNYAAVHPSTDELSRPTPSLSTSLKKHKRTITATNINNPTGTPQKRQATTGRTAVPPSSPPTGPMEDETDVEDMDDLEELENNGFGEHILSAMYGIQSTLLQRLSDMEATLMGRINQQADTISQLNTKVASISKENASLKKTLSNFSNTLKKAATSPSLPTSQQSQTQQSTSPQPTPTPTTGKEKVVPSQTSSQPNESSKTQSFAEVAAGSPEEWNLHTNKKKKKSTKTIIPLQNRRFLILREQDAGMVKEQGTLVKVRDTINKVLREHMAKESEDGNVVVAVSCNFKGNLMVTTREDIKADAVIAHGKLILHWLKDLNLKTSSIQDSHQWPKIILNQVDTSAFPDTPEGMDKLKQELETNNCNFKVQADTLPRYLKSASTRAKEVEDGIVKMHTSMVICCSSRQQAEQAVSKGLFVWGMRLRVKPYLSARPTDMCKRCLGFGHHEGGCRKPANCNICSQQHPTLSHTCTICNKQGILCSCTPPSCYHCKEEHLASDPKCAATATIRSRFQQSQHPASETPEVHMQDTN